jgi:hypothetical protein
MKLIVKAMSAGRMTLFVAIITVLLMPEVAFSQWVFVARHAIGRIEQVTQSQSSPNQAPTEVVTVILDAPAQRIFDVAVNAIQKNQNISIVDFDQPKMTIKISQGDQVASLSIKQFSKDTAQLIIVGTAAPGQIPQTTRIVDGVMRLCADLGKECKLAN